MTESDIREVLVSEFGNEGFSLKFTDKRTFKLILHYPKLVIRNSRNEFHNITDLYIKIEKWPYGLEGTGASFQGARASLTKEEYVSHYSHSHLPQSILGFNSFCLGTSDMGVLLHENFFNSKEELEYFLNILRSYLSWESLEGVPYISINSISKYYKLNSSAWYDRDFIKRIPIGCNIQVNLNFEVKNFLEVEEYLTEYLKKEHFGITSDYYFANKIGNNYFGSEIRTDLSLINQEVLVFNGKSITLTLNESNQEHEQSKINRVANPSLTKQFIKRIQREIKNFYIRGCRNEASVSSGNS